MTDDHSQPQPRRSRLRKLLWIGLFCCLGLGLIVVGGLVFTQTAPFRQIVKNLAESQVSGLLTGSLEIGSLEGNFYSRLELHDLVLRDRDGLPLADIQRVLLHLDHSELFDAHVIVDAFAIERPRVHLRVRDGVLNATTLVPPGDDPVEESASEPFTIGGLKDTLRDLGLPASRATIREIALRDGSLLYDRADRNGTVIVADAADLHLRLRADAEVAPTQELAANVTIDEISVVPQVPAVPPVFVASAVRADFNGALVEHLVAEFGALHLHGGATARVVDDNDLDLRAEIGVRAPDLADVQAVLVDVPDIRDVLIMVSASGNLDRLTTNVEFRSSAANLSTRGEVRLAEGGPCYDVGLNWWGVNLAPLLAMAGSDALSSDLSGSLLAYGAGTDPETLRLEAAVESADSRIKNQPLGTLRLATRVEALTLPQLFGEVEAGKGRIGFNGTAALAGLLDPASEARADLRVDSRDFDAGFFLPDGQMRSDLDLDLRLNARKPGGIDVAQVDQLLDTQVSILLEGSGSSLTAAALEGPLTLSKLTVDGALQDRRMNLEQVRVLGMGLDIEATGEVDPAGPVAADVAARVTSWDFFDLVAPDLGVGGTVTVDAAIAGTMADLNGSFTVGGADLRYDTLGLASLQATGQFADVQPQAFDLTKIRATTDLEIADVSLPGQRVDGLTATVRVQDDVGDFELDADIGEEAIGLTGTVTPLLGDPWDLALGRLRLTTDGMDLANDGTIDLTAGTKAATIRQFTLTDGSQRLDLRGTAAYFGDYNLAVTVDNLAISQWLALAQQDLPAEGQVGLSVRVQGTAKAPRVTGNLRLADVSYDGSPTVTSQIGFRYRDNVAGTDGFLEVFDRRAMTFDLSAPLTVAVPPKEPIFTPEGNLTGELHLLDFDLARLQDLPEDLREAIPYDLTGVVWADVRLGGTFDAPDLNLSLGVNELTIADSGQDVNFPPVSADLRGSYEMGRLKAHGEVHLPERRLLALHAEAPLTLSIPPEGELFNPEDAFTVRVDLPDLNLTMLDRLPLSIQEGIPVAGRGHVMVRAEARGTIADPEIDVDASLQRGTFTLKASNLELPPVSTSLALRYREDDLRLNSKVRSLDTNLLLVEVGAPMRLGYPLPEVLVAPDTPLRGRIRVGEIDLTRVQRLPDALQGSIPVQPSGRLNLQGRVTGTLKAPNLNLTFAARNVRLKPKVQVPKDATLPEAPVLAGRGHIGYRDGLLTATLDGRANDKHVLSGTSRVPLNLGYPAGGDILPEEGKLAGAFHIALHDLSEFDGLLAIVPARMEGRFDTNISLTGTVAEPDLDGRVLLTGGRFRSDAFQVDYRDLELRADATLDRVRLERLDLKSQVVPRIGLGNLFGNREPIRGSLSATAEVAFGEKGIDNLSGDVTFSNFVPLSSPDTFVITDGSISASGDMNALWVRGDVTLPEGRVTIPDFSGERTADDITITDTSQGGNLVFRDTVGGPNWFKQHVGLDVGVTLPGQFFLVNPESNIELQGGVQAKKKPGDELVVAGSIQTKRGFITFLGKEFSITRGEVSFTGGTAIDPVLDLRADYEIDEDDRDVTIILRVQGRVSAPEITLDSEPIMEDADRISYLLFGKRQDELGEGEGSTPEAQAIALLSGQLASKMNAMLGDTLAVDVFKVRTGEEGLSDGSVTVGKYISDRVFVSASQGLGEEGGTTVTIEYSILEWLKLVGEAGSDNTTGGDIVIEFEY